MEIEMKYAIPDKETAEQIMDDELINQSSDLSLPENVVMKAIYFDTEDSILAKNDVSVRVRAEGDHCFATLKWGGKYDNGMHSREEINIPVKGETCFMQIPVDTFKLSEDGRRLMDLIGDKPLINLFEMRFLRQRKKIHFGSSVMEISVDLGNIIGEHGQVPIQEAEIELFAGDESDIRELGKLLCEKYKLLPKQSSKFADGLAVI